MRAVTLFDAPRFPITVGTGLSALVVTLLYWSRPDDVEWLQMSPLALLDEPWRLLTSMLPHGDVLHLLFNLYWLWVFGTWLERNFGHGAMALLVVVLALSSSLAQHAVSGGAIGLSGVGYGLLGFLWATAQLDRRYQDAMDTRTLQLFLAWGLLCIVLTALGLWHIANTAHAAGLVFGLGLGAARAWRGSRRWATAAGLLLASVAVAAFATTWRPLSAFADRDALEYCYDGWRALENKDDERALWLLERAARHPEVSPGCQLNYGIALQRGGRQAEASEVYERAIQRDPSLDALAREP